MTEQNKQKDLNVTFSVEFNILNHQIRTINQKIHNLMMEREEVLKQKDLLKSDGSYIVA